MVVVRVLVEADYFSRPTFRTLAGIPYHPLFFRTSHHPTKVNLVARVLLAMYIYGFSPISRSKYISFLLSWNVNSFALQRPLLFHVHFFFLDPTQIKLLFRIFHSTHTSSVLLSSSKYRFNDSLTVIRQQQFINYFSTFSPTSTISYILAQMTQNSSFHVCFALESYWTILLQRWQFTVPGIF